MFARGRFLANTRTVNEEMYLCRRDKVRQTRMMRARRLARHTSTIDNRCLRTTRMTQKRLWLPQRRGSHSEGQIHRATCAAHCLGAGAPNIEENRKVGCVDDAVAVEVATSAAIGVPCVQERCEIRGIHEGVAVEICWARRSAATVGDRDELIARNEVEVHCAWFTEIRTATESSQDLVGEVVVTATVGLRFQRRSKRQRHRRHPCHR